MVELDTSIPQLKALKRVLDAYSTLNMNNVQPLLSENYQYEAFPESADLPKLTKEGHRQTWGGIFSSLNKFETTCHEVIDAPGKVVVHLTAASSTVSGATYDYEATVTNTFVEEDGELKLLNCKDFANPQQRSALVAGTLKVAAERAAV